MHLGIDQCIVIQECCEGYKDRARQWSRKAKHTAIPITEIDPQIDKPSFCRNAPTLSLIHI